MSNTQPVFNIFSLQPVRIKPSIMEGESLYTSVLGPDAAISITRYAPTLLTPPVISGFATVPATLTCNQGSFAGSPSPLFSYQWEADGVPIGGATTNTYGTDELDDGVTFTCVVTATNLVGSVSSESNGITAILVNSINVWEFDTYAIQGLPAKNNIAVHDAMFAVITGLGSKDNMTVQEFDTYSVLFPTFVTALTVTNPGAETGDTSGWTTESGTFVSTLDDAKAGTRYFAAEGLLIGGHPLTRVTQTIAIPGGQYALVDAGNCLVQFTHSANSDEIVPNNTYEFFIEAIDGTSGVATKISPFGVMMPPSKSYAVGTNNWTDYVSLPMAIPSNTRDLRIVIEFAGVSSSSNSIEVDEISLSLYAA